MKMTSTPADMKALENRFMEENHVPGALLMEHAAQGVVDAIARYTDKGTVVFLCGPGNNGGDGYAAARLWAARGGKAHIVEVTADVRGDALLNRNLAMMNPNILFSSAEDAYYGNPECDVVVDALFGTGLARPIAGAAADLVHFALDAQLHRKPVIAVDIPSGIDGTTGKALGHWVVRATETVTFHCIKQGLLLANAPDYVGKITVQPILIPPSDDPGLYILEPGDLQGYFSRPRPATREISGGWCCPAAAAAWRALRPCAPTLRCVPARGRPPSSAVRACCLFCRRWPPVRCAPSSPKGTACCCRRLPRSPAKPSPAQTRPASAAAWGRPPT